MKKFISIMLVLLMVFSMSACGGASGSNDEGPSPTEVMDSFLKALKAGDLETAAQYYDGNIDKINFMEDGDDPIFSDVMDDLTEKMLDFDYTLSNETVKKNDATVDVEFTTYDLGNVMNELLMAVMSDSSALALMGADQGELEAVIAEIVKTKFDEVIKSVNKDTTVTVTVNMVKKKGKWLIKDLADTDDFMNALSGGILQYADSLGDVLG